MREGYGKILGNTLLSRRGDRQTLVPASLYEDIVKQTVECDRLCICRFTSNEYLVDPASCHMLVSKIKPCMSKHKPNMVKPRMAHYNSLSLLDLRVLLG